MAIVGQFLPIILFLLTEVEAFSGPARVAQSVSAFGC